MKSNKISSDIKVYLTSRPEMEERPEKSGVISVVGVGRQLEERSYQPLPATSLLTISSLAAPGPPPLTVAPAQIRGEERNNRELWLFKTEISTFEYYF